MFGEYPKNKHKNQLNNKDFFLYPDKTIDNLEKVSKLDLSLMSEVISKDKEHLNCK